jgi:glycosyltransferase involved in cell wall biosynthesis
MLISVVIPCYNGERTIASTIESALSQDVEREIIVVDDGSTDRSAEIIASFGNHVCVEHGPNRGVSAARNRGGELARGSFIQYLDSDDQLAPGTLERRREALLSSGADAAYTDWQKLVETAESSFALGEVMVPAKEALEVDAEAACAGSQFWVPPAAILYRRGIVERIGGWQPTLPVIQDARFLFDAAVQSGKFVYVAGVGAFYRVRADSLSRQNRPKFLQDCLLNAREIEALWRSRKVLTPGRIDTLRSMWWHSAIAALVDGSSEFEAARQKHNSIGARRFALEAAWLLRRVLGAQAASAIARSELRRRADRVMRSAECS